MFRIFIYILVIAGFSYGLSLMADMDGKLIIQWPGGEIQPSLMQAVLVFSTLLIVVMLLWTFFRMILSSPETFSRYLSVKKKKKGIDALSSGLIALGSGDDVMAQRYALQAKKTMPNDPMTLMLRAQAAELKGDVFQATRLYESMLAATDTELFGLRGLYLLALQQNELEPAAQYAARAAHRRPDLPWAVLGLFDLQCKKRAWRGALDSLKVATERGHIRGKEAKRKRAILLTALAVETEDTAADEALKFAVEAVKLAPSLIPAAVIAGRIYASKGQMSPSIKVIQKSWRLAPHPDLAVVSAFARPGDSVRDRLERIKSLAKLTPGHKEAALAVATAAIEAQDWATARESLGPLTRGRPTQRVCTLMARIEAADSGDTGLVREWLARAIHALQDPQWVADGIVADEWAPISPVSGKLDVFEWKVPPEDEVVSEETHTLKQLLAGLVVSEGLREDHTIEGPDADGSGNKATISDGEVDDNGAELSEQVEGSSSDEDLLDEDLAEVKEIEEADIVSVKADDLQAQSKVNHSVDAGVDDRENLTETAALAVDVQDTSIGEVVVEDEKSSTVRDKDKSADSSKDKASNAKAPTTKNRRRRRKRTKIFVAPHAPDDPGTDESEELELADSIRPIRF